MVRGGTLALAAPGEPATPLTLSSGPDLVGVQALAPVPGADGAGRWCLLARAAGDAVACLWRLALTAGDAAGPRATLTALAGNGEKGPGSSNPNSLRGITPLPGIISGCVLVLLPWGGTIAECATW